MKKAYPPGSVPPIKNIDEVQKGTISISQLGGNVSYDVELEAEEEWNALFRNGNQIKWPMERHP